MVPALVLSLLNQAIARQAGADWPRFLGPSADNRSPEAGLRESWPTNGPALLWSKQVGTGYGAPSVLGEKLVLHHRVQDEEVVESLNARNGNSFWRYSYRSSFADPYGYNNGPRCTPLLTSNRCYTFGAQGKLLCLDLDTGTLVWQRDTAKDWNVPEPFFGVGSTPLLEEQKLIVMVGGQPDSAIVAFDAANGKTLWESGGKKNWDGVRTIGWRGEAPYRWTGEEKLASYSTPVAATIHGQRNLLCLTRQGLLSCNPTNGQVNFCRWFQSTVNESVNAMCPIVLDDLVLISAAYYRVGSVALRVNADGQTFSEAWRSPTDPMTRDPATGEFPTPVLEAHFNTPVLDSGYLYAFSGRNEPDATFRCIEFKTGRLMWSRDERWRPHSVRQPPVYGRGSAILADGKLIVLGEGGKLGIFVPTPKEPTELCSWQVPPLHFPCWTAPVLSHKKLYLRSEDWLLCFDWSR